MNQELDSEAPAAYAIEGDVNLLQQYITEGMIATSQSLSCVQNTVCTSYLHQQYEMELANLLCEPLHASIDDVSVMYTRAAVLPLSIRHTVAPCVMEEVSPTSLTVGLTGSEKNGKG